MITVIQPYEFLAPNPPVPRELPQTPLQPYTGAAGTCATHRLEELNNKVDMRRI